MNKNLVTILASAVALNPGSFSPGMSYFTMGPGQSKAKKKKRLRKMKRASKRRNR